jgi:hypothetical protein
MKMYQTKVVEKIKTHILCSITFFYNRVFFLDNLKKYSKAGEATDDNILRRIRITRWTPSAINTHSE